MSKQTRPMNVRRMGGLWGACAGAMLATVCSSAVCAQATTNPANVKPQTYKPVREYDAAGNVAGPLRAGWWNDAVFYQVFVRSFADSTEGPLANDGVGDLRGLIEKLDYLSGDPEKSEGLGVTALWLMPIMESPSYHGYDVVDYFHIKKDYGTNQDFRDLMRECHKRGMKVIIDLVLNHTSNRNPWFKAAAGDRDAAAATGASRDWYIFSESGDSPFKGPWHQDVWHRLKGPAGASRPTTYYGLFGGDMPDLNYRNPEVTRRVHDLSAWWLDTRTGRIVGDGQTTEPPMDVDGFRLDAIRHLIEEGEVQDNTLATHEWLKEYRRICKDGGAAADTFCIGEVWSTSEAASSYVGDQLDAAFEFDLAGAMVEACRTGLAKPLIEAQSTVLKFYPPNQYGRFLTNHDQPRVMTQLKGSDGAMRVAAVLLLTGPGIPFVYYGEEIGLTGDKPDPKIRTPMPWSGGKHAGFSGHRPWQAPNSGFEKLNVVDQRADESSLWNLYRRLIAARRAEPSLRHGAIVPVQCEGFQAAQVYAFLRTSSEASAVLVVCNLGDEPVTGYRLSAAAGAMPTGLGKQHHVVDLLTSRAQAGLQVEANGGFEGYRPASELAAHGCMVLKLAR